MTTAVMKRWWLLPLFLLLATAANAAPPFPRDFAPGAGMVAPPEKPYRDDRCLNGLWQFQPVALPAGWKPDQGTPPELSIPDDARWERTPIRIPSPWNVNAFNQGDGGDFRCYPSYPVAWESVSMGWLRRSFTIPAGWHGRRLILHFEAVAGDAAVYVNGKKVGENFDAFLPFECDVTDVVHAEAGATNELRVGVRKASLFDDTRTFGRRPYLAGSFWGQSVVGIWQDVTLEAVPLVRVDDVFVRPNVAQDTIEADVTLRNDSVAPRTIAVGGAVQAWHSDAGSAVLDAPEPRGHLDKAEALALPSQTVTLQPGRTATVTLGQSVGGKLALWTPDAPNLYGLTVTVQENGKAATVLDRHYVRFGWRQFTFDGNRQLLNGKPLELKGDSWHFLGIPQMTRRYSWAWFRALKDAHGNAVRLHAEPYPAFYLDMADEMGVCVLDETANWGSDGAHKYDAPLFWQRADDEVARLIRRDRNHASVFGWSVSNEVSWFVDRAKHPELLDRLHQGWTEWRKIAQTLDPTRPWISTDGDGDGAGTMPTDVRHYANLEGLSRGAKPYGMGETGGAYYAAPPYAAKFGGSRAYDSQEGRMEGIAVEAYELIATQRRQQADYASVFNLIWYGLKPLPLGLPDTSRPYTSEDGIRFGAFRPDAPGVQPERLGPYCTTVNPGYDPRLPLYQPWPLFDAIAAAYAPTGPAPSLWDHRAMAEGAKSAVATPVANPIDRVVALAGANARLPAMLYALGANVGGEADLNTATRLIVIDGANPPTGLSADALGRLSASVRNGATCLIYGVASGAALATLNALLPAPVQLTERHASSFVVTAARDPLLAGIDDASLYFTDLLPGDAARQGLAGPFVSDGGQALIAAASADWRRWNNRPEPQKTAAILRSEREAKPSGAVVVAHPFRKGRYIVSALDTTSAAAGATLPLLKHLLTNAGLTLTDRPMDAGAAFDFGGTLKQALVCGSFPATIPAAYDTDNIGITPTFAPQPGDKSGTLTWTPQSAGKDGAFNFRSLHLPGPTDNAVVYLSFWLWSPRALDNLLLEPNLPRLDLLAGADDGCQIYLNGKVIQQERGTHPLVAGSIVCPSLPLQRGWNRFVVKVVQQGGEWGFRANLRCSDPLFQSQLKSSIAEPRP